MKGFEIECYIAERSEFTITQQLKSKIVKVEIIVLIAMEIWCNLETNWYHKHEGILKPL